MMLQAMALCGQHVDDFPGYERVWKEAGSIVMATRKKGHLTAAREWWKHLRAMKRDFWKRERKAARADALREAVRQVETRPTSHS